MCNCVNKITKTASKSVIGYVDQKTNVHEWLNTGTFDNLSLVIKDGHRRIGMPFIFEYIRQRANGEPEKRVTREHAIIYPTFCPFCGEKFEQA